MTILNDIKSSSLPVPFEKRAVDDFTIALRGICGGFDVLAQSGRKSCIEGGLVAKRYGSYDAAIIALDAERVSRTTKDIRRDPSDYLFLLFQEEGDCLIAQGDEEPSARLLPGDMYLVDSTRPSQFIYNGTKSKQISLHLPRDEVFARFGRQGLGGVGIEREDPLAFALRATIAKLVSVETASTPLISEALMNLLGAYLRCSVGIVADGERRSDRVLEEACLLIARRAWDAGLDSAEVADTLGISLRTLQRRFEAIGETLAGRILNTRLDLAHSMLREAEGTGQQPKVATIAFDCGFNDLSTFYRAFRNRFGMPPGNLSRNAKPDDAEC